MRDLLADDFEVARRIVTSDGWMALVCASKLDRMLGEQFESPDFALRHMVADHPSHRRPHQVDSAGSPTSAHPAGGQLSGWPSRRMGGVGRLGGARHPADLPQGLPL
jgi:hypothetical protein